jgi:hypothetical protein
MDREDHENVNFFTTEVKSALSKPPTDWLDSVLQERAKRAKLVLKENIIKSKLSTERKWLLQHGKGSNWFSVRQRN